MRVQRRFFLTALLMPTLTAAVGIDGGAVFQIAAVENLGLDARVVGIAFGLGVLSVPVQLLAARMPLWRARRNIQLFLGITAVQCAVLALLLATAGPGDRIAVVALVVTVLAEISLSVLYATAWHPLLSFALTPVERQRLNSRGFAASGLLKAGAALLFGAVVLGGRVAYFVVAAAVAVGLAYVLRHVPAPERPPPSTAKSSTRIPDAARPLYVVVGLTAAGAWPLFIVYVDNVLWPTINLGLVAAVQLAGSLLAAAFWKTTTGEVQGRARWAAAASAACAFALATIDAPVGRPVEQLVFFVSLAGAAAATSTVFMTVMELAHRVIDPETSVRAMTLYDVAASTSMQTGLLVAGFLVAASDDGGGRADLYRLYLVAVAALTLLALTRLGRRRPARPPGDRSTADAG